MTIKITIKEIRERKKMSLRKLEEKTGIEREYLADIENGKIPSNEILFAEMVVISEALACSILELYEIGHLEIKGIGEF